MSQASITQRGTRLRFTQIDLLFASDTIWVWDTEKRFQELKLEHAALVHGWGPHEKRDVGLEEVEGGQGKRE